MIEKKYKVPMVSALIPVVYNYIYFFNAAVYELVYLFILYLLVINYTRCKILAFLRDLKKGIFQKNSKNIQSELFL